MATEKERQIKKKKKKKKPRVKFVSRLERRVLSTYRVLKNSCALSDDKIKVEHEIDRHDLLSAIDTR